MKYDSKLHKKLYFAQLEKAVCYLQNDPAYWIAR